MTSTVSIQLGKPSGINPQQADDEVLHDMNWEGPNWGTVQFLHGSHSFTLPFVESISGSERELESSDGGMDEWEITANFAAETPIPTESAIQTLMQLFAQLGALGWERYIHPCAPRLKGKEAMQFALEHDHDTAEFGLDPAYTPTPEEWGEIEELSVEWNFRANGVHLSVWLCSAQSSFLMHLKTEGLVIIEQVEHSFPDGDYRSHQSNDKFKKWLAKNVPKLKETQAQTRRKIEAEMSAEGFTIDQIYQDPRLAWFDRLPLTSSDSASAVIGNGPENPATAPDYGPTPDAYLHTAGKVESSSHLGTLVLIAVIALAGYIVYTHPELLKNLLAKAGL